MASTFTTNIRLEQQEDGAIPKSWGTVLNNNVIALIDRAAKKGLFGGDQLSTIGAMRERFHAELKEQAPAENNVTNIENEEPPPQEIGETSLGES